MINPLKLLRSKKYLDTIESDAQEIKLNPTNWRTSVNGIIAALLQLSHIWIPASNLRLVNTVDALTALFIALGLYHAADKQNLPGA